MFLQDPFMLFYRRIQTGSWYRVASGVSRKDTQGVAS